MVYMHFNNLKVYLQSKGLFKGYQIDQADENMCKVFGVVAQQTVGGLETEEESWVFFSKSFYVMFKCSNFWNFVYLLPYKFNFCLFIFKFSKCVNFFAFIML